MDTLQVIIECSADGQIDNELGSFGKVKYRLPMINAYVLEIERSQIQKLENVNFIKAVYSTRQVTAQMNIARKTVKADAAQGQGLTGRGVSIGFLDTGVGESADLISPRNRILAFRDFVNSKSDSYDDNGHGTHVAY